MYKIFGTKEDKEYKDRIGAYIIPVKGNEPVEPDHVFKFVKFEDIENKMYLEMQRWAIEQAMAH